MCEREGCCVCCGIFCLSSDQCCVKIDGFGALFFTLFLRLCSSFWVVALQGHSVHVCDCLAAGFHVPPSSPEECLQDLSKHWQFRPKCCTPYLQHEPSFVFPDPCLYLYSVYVCRQAGISVAEVRTETAKMLHSRCSATTLLNWHLVSGDKQRASGKHSPSMVLQLPFRRMLP